MSDSVHSRHAMAVRLGVDVVGVPSMPGWRLLPGVSDPAMLTVLLRRQGRLLESLGGVGLLLRIETSEWGDRIEVVRDHRGALRPEGGPDLVPKALSADEAVRWCQIAEAFAASHDAPPPTVEPVAVGRVRRAAGLVADLACDLMAEIADTPRWLARSGSSLARMLSPREWAMSGAIGASAFALVALGPHALPHVEDAYKAMVQTRPAGYASAIASDDLADGGTVRKLQGVAQAFGRRY